MREDLIELLRKRAADHGGDKLLEESAAALEAAREDAARYRWLRSSHWYVGLEPEGDTDGVSLHDFNGDAELDAAIDQARGIVPEAGQGVQS